MSAESVSVERKFLYSLLAGACAGLSVDVSLYPLDTLKTRLQAPQGFLKAGGFRGVYKGLSAVVAGSAPGAAIFFSTYETSKSLLYTDNKKSFLSGPITHMIAASTGEVMACSVRVPTEVIKQKMQTGVHASFPEALAHIFKHEAGIRGFYKGYMITIMREIPFALIQFPIYEYLKANWNTHRLANGQSEIAPYQVALCGSVSGAIGAAATTPLDVIKTRVQLGVDARGVAYKGVVDVISSMLKETADSHCSNSNSNSDVSSSSSSSCKRSIFRRRLSLFFSGVQPRVMWISIGGFVFFGAYDQSHKIISSHL